MSTDAFLPIDPETERIGKEILDSAFQVHSILGPGLLESVYETCLAHELREKGFVVDTQVPVPIKYKGVNLDAGFRLDMMVEKSVIVEIKAVEQIVPIHEAQLLTYLRLSNIRLGYILNFFQRRLKDGIKRIIV